MNMDMGGGGCLLFASAPPDLPDWLTRCDWKAAKKK